MLCVLLRNYRAGLNSAIKAKPGKPMKKLIARWVWDSLYAAQIKALDALAHSSRSEVTHPMARVFYEEQKAIKKATLGRL